MPNTIFIFAKRLTEQQISQFVAETDSVLLKQAVYLSYDIAFFETNLTACNLREAANQIAADVADLAIAPNLTEAGLLVMDMDSTAIKIECIDEIAKLAGSGEIVSAITARVTTMTRNWAPTCAPARPCRVRSMIG